MDLNKALENFFYYGFIAWSVFLFYLLFGNGILPLAFVEIPHPYHAMVQLPDWTMLSVLMFFFIFARVTSENEEHDKTTAIIFLMGSSALWVQIVGGTITHPSIWGFIGVFGSTLMVAGSALNFWWKWGDTMRDWVSR